MKFHATITTILISVFIALLFVSVAIFVVAEMNMLSPTLIATNYIMEQVAAIDSDLSVSFSSIERNLRDRFLIHDLLIKYKGNELLYFDTIKIQKGLFGVIQFGLTGNGVLSIVADDGKLNLSSFTGKEAADDEEKEPFDIRSLVENKIQIIIPEALSRWGFEVNLNGFDITIPGGQVTEITNLNLYWDHGIEDFYLRAQVANSDFIFGDTNLSLHNFHGSFDYTDKFHANISLGSGSISMGDINGSIEGLALSAIIDDISSFYIDDIPVFLGFDSVDGDINGSKISVGAMDFSALGTIAEIDIGNINASYNSYAASAETIKINTDDFDVFNIEFINLEALDSEKKLASINSFSSYINVEEMKAGISIPQINVDNISGFTGGFITEGELNNINLESYFKDRDLFFELQASPYLSCTEKLFHGLTFDLLFDGSVTFNDFSHEDKIEVEKLNFKLGEISSKEFSTDIYLDIDYDGSGISAIISNSDTLNGSISFDKKLNILLTTDGYELSDLNKFISEYVPIISNYVSDNTELTSTIKAEFTFDKQSKLGFTGPVAYSIELNDINFNQSAFSLGTNLKSVINSDNADIQYFDIESDFVDIAFSGTVPFEHMLPEGNFAILTPDRTSNYLSGDLWLSDIREYTYFGSTSKLRDTNIFGVVDFKTENIIRSDANFTLLGTPYELFLDINLLDDYLTLVNNNLDILVTWSDILSASIKFMEFPLSKESPEIAPGSLNGDINFEFDFGNQSFRLDIPGFELNHINHLPDNPDIGFSISADNDHIDISSLYIRSENYPELKGSSYTDFTDNSFALYVSDSTNEETFLASVINTDGGYLSTLRGDSLKLSRFGLDGLIGNFVLSGSAAKLQDFSFAGILSAKSDGEENDSREITANINIDDSYLKLTDVVYSTDSISIGIPSVSFEASSGYLDINRAFAQMTFEQLDGPFTLSAELSAGVNIAPGDTIISSIASNVSSGFNGVRFSGILHKASISDYISAYDKEFNGTYKNNHLEFDGELINGYYSIPDGNIDITLNADPIAACRINGDLKVDSKFDVNVDLKMLDVSIINYIFKLPVLEFEAGGKLYGNINVSSGESGLQLHGRFGTDYAAFDVFWLTNQRIILHNAEFEIWDNDIETVLCNATIEKLDTLERSRVDIRVGLRFDEGFGFESWDIDVYIDEDNMADFRLPMTGSNIDITGKVGGHYHIDATTSLVESSGDVFVKDVILSFGMQSELPSWWGTSIENSIDLSIDMRDNIQFVFPYGNNPILRAVIADNTKINFSLSPNTGIKASGDIPLRSGEIFYFQKYFYITEGNIRLSETLEGGINPVINLRARIRDFDSSGDKVDIYLNLNEATLDNISPSFDSSPAKDQNEIMSILGQAIIPVDNLNTTGTSMQSVVTMAAASVDMLSNLGVFGNFGKGLDSSIRQGLTLDTFSLHTNVLSNLLNDTARLTGISSAVTALSPVARYLDGTTLYLGKYLSPEVYLSAMFHLSARRNENRSGFSFLADDLILDTELSLEWTSPIATVTFFSKPASLTLYEFIDKFGFSLTKRIVF